MNEGTLIKVENLSKRFCRSLNHSLWYGIQDISSEICGRRHGQGTSYPLDSSNIQLRQNEFWAVKDVSFELKRGECLGLIGSNGAGKTTLLRMLNGLIKPDTGSVQINGTMGALIALGAGFNPILTGRENVYTNASILGMTKTDVDGVIDEIIDFAEIRKFIDSPVQSYSSGMQVRLGFAVAVFMHYDVVLLDEILAVGDIKFRNKCYNALSRMRENGTSFILVNHNTAVISLLCDRAIHLNDGCVQVYGKTIDAINSYESASIASAIIDPKIKATNTDNMFFVELRNSGISSDTWTTLMAGEIVFALRDYKPTSKLAISYIFRGLSFAGINVTCHGQLKLSIAHEEVINNDITTLSLKCKSVSLPPGDYTLKFAVWEDTFKQIGALESIPVKVVMGTHPVSDATHFQDCEFVVDQQIAI